MQATQKSLGPRLALVAFPTLVLLGYVAFMVSTYWPFLDSRLRLRSPSLAGLPEDVIGLGFWMWWPIAALLFATSLAVSVGANRPNRPTIAGLLVWFAVLSIADYLLCQRLISELLRSPLIF